MAVVDLHLAPRRQVAVQNTPSIIPKPARTMSLKTIREQEAIPQELREYMESEAALIEAQSLLKLMNSKAGERTLLLPFISWKLHDIRILSKPFLEHQFYYYTSLNQTKTYFLKDAAKDLYKIDISGNHLVSIDALNNVHLAGLI